MQLRAANDGGTCFYRSRFGYRTLPNNNPKGTFMKCASIVKAAAAVAVAVGLAACTGIKPHSGGGGGPGGQLAQGEGGACGAKKAPGEADNAGPIGQQAGHGPQRHGEH